MYLFTTFQQLPLLLFQIKSKFLTLEYEDLHDTTPASFPISLSSKVTQNYLLGGSTESGTKNSSFPLTCPREVAVFNKTQTLIKQN